jgi:hypothetical protein
MSHRNEVAQILDGVALIISLNIAVFSLLMISASWSVEIALINLFLASRIGILQLFYGIPWIIWLSRQQKWGLMKGLIIGIIITALLNGGCWLGFPILYR